MTITSQGKNASKRKKISKWDEAITDAKKMINKLRFTIKVYSERRDRGEPWPGEKRTATPLHDATQSPSR